MIKPNPNFSQQLAKKTSKMPFHAPTTSFKSALLTVRNMKAVPRLAS